MGGISRHYGTHANFKMHGPSLDKFGYEDLIFNYDFSFVFIKNSID